MEYSMSTLPVLLSVLRKKIMEEQIKDLEQFDITKQHVHYIIVLWNHKEGLIQKEIVEFAHFDKAHASRALKELVDKDMIYKEDKSTYKNKYYLTKKGLKIAETMKSKNHKIIEDVFSILSDEEKKQMEQILKKLTDHMNSTE